MERNRGKQSLRERIKSPENEAFKYGCDGSHSFQLSSLFFSFYADSWVWLVVWCEKQGP